jgi:molecular chaperone DnaJ
VVSVQHTFLGDMQSASTCRVCNGAGTSIENPCSDCEGQGRVPDRQRVTVEVPAGIRDSQQLRLSGFGEAGMHGASAGDLIVTCRIQGHEFFEREENHLHARANISIVQAALGAEIEIQGILPEEMVKIRIPEGCQNEQVVQAKNYGMPHFRGSARGDMYVHINVVIPKKVSKRERELLEELASVMGEDVSEERSPLQKLRDIFD